MWLHKVHKKDNEFLGCSINNLFKCFLPIANEYSARFFFKEVRAENGDDYYSKTFHQMLVSLQMLLNEEQPTEKIYVFKDPEFLVIAINIYK